MPDSDLAERYDLHRTIDYIVNGGYRRVALQFPDEQLPDSPAVSQLLQRGLGERATVFILADTAYNPLGVDEVAAHHLAAQCVVHYGRASLDPVTSLPAFFVLPKDPLNVQETASAVRQAVSDAVRARCAAAAPGASAHSAAAVSSTSSSFSAVVVLLDQAYQHRLGDLSTELLQGGMPGPGGGAAEDNAGNTCGKGGENNVQGDASPAQPPWIFARVAAKSLSPRQIAPNQRPPPQPARGGCCGDAATAPGTTAAASIAAVATNSPGCCHGGAAAAQPGGAACLGVTQAPALTTAPAAGGGEECVSGGDGSCCTVTRAAGSIQRDGCGAGLAGGGVACEDGSPVGASVDTTQAAVGTTIANLQAADMAEAGSAVESEAAARAGLDADGSSGGSGSSTPCTCRMVGLCWSLPPGVSRRDCLYVWVGPYGSSAHQVLQLTHSTCEWISYDPGEEGGAVRQGLSDDTRRLLKRRNYLVERVRNANIVGLLVGTLGSAGFLDVISALRRLAIAAGKKTYTFLMGKPNPAKLGNFPEVDVFVMVCDAQGLILDCRDYLVPLVSPWEAATALLGRHLEPDDYRMEMRDVLELEAQYRQQQQQQETEAEGSGMALQALGNLGLNVASRGAGELVVARTAAEFLALKRTFRGLEMPATGACPKAPELAVEGLCGRAAVYSDEGASQVAEAGEPGSGSGAADAW
ncbi:hypothetical protein Vafri_8184 [Volvox africanus]|nr:hypothetical protein Vafri_8184 [Volvox africanus]